MNISIQAGSGPLSNCKSIFPINSSKSEKEKFERQQKCENQVVYWENQKEQLKNMKCDTLDEISRKLEILGTYNDQIAAVKEAYNHEQMKHVMDEAKERGEKIAEAVEKLEPKTAKERREDLKEEALGMEDDKGMMTEMLEELSDTVEELVEEMAEEMAFDELDSLEALESAELSDDITNEDIWASDVVSEDTITEKAAMQKMLKEHRYAGIDIRV